MGSGVSLVNSSGGNPAGFEFNEDYGVIVSKFDPGFPEVRNVEDARPHQHGMVNYTKFFGAREVNIEFMVIPAMNKLGMNRRKIMDDLRALLNPGLTVYLKEEIDGTPLRRIRVVPGQFSMPFEFVNRNSCQISWRAPDGFWEADEQQEIFIPPTPVIAPDTGGRTYSLHGGADRAYSPGSNPTGGISLTNAGNVEAYPLIRMYGPCVDASIINVTRNEQMVFVALNLSAGQWVDVNLRDRTALQMSDINQSVYSKINWATSTWIRFQTGINSILYTPTTYTVGTTQAIVFYRDNWI